MFFNCMKFARVPFSEDIDVFNQTGTIFLGMIFLWEIGLLKTCFIYLSQIKY